MQLQDPRVQPFLAKILAEGGVPDIEEPWYDHKNNFLYDTLAKEHLFENVCVLLHFYLVVYCLFKQGEEDLVQSMPLYFIHSYAIVTYGDHMCGHPGISVPSIP